MFFKKFFQITVAKSEYIVYNKNTIEIAEWSSLVARRAHNPKVVWFKSRLRNQKKHHPNGWCFFIVECGLKDGGRFCVLSRSVKNQKAPTVYRCFYLLYFYNLAANSFAITKRLRLILKFLGKFYFTPFFLLESVI